MLCFGASPLNNTSTIPSGGKFGTMLQQQKLCCSKVYGVCGSRNYRGFGRRATDVKTGNAGPKLHWLAGMGEKVVLWPFLVNGTS